jgi:signal transduction histidine kinase
VTGTFLLAAIVGTVLQTLAIQAVVRPMEARELRARADLAVTSVAAAFAAAPVIPEGAALDTLLRHERVEHSIRPGILVVRRSAGAVTSPPGFAPLLTDSAGSGREPGRNEVIARQALMRGNQVVGEVLVSRRAPRGPGPGLGFGLSPLTWWVYFPMAALLSTALALLLVRLLARHDFPVSGVLPAGQRAAIDRLLLFQAQIEIGRVAEQLNRMAERLSAARDAFSRRTIGSAASCSPTSRMKLVTLSPPSAARRKRCWIPACSSAEDRTRYTRGVLEESRRLDRMIRDLFELSRLEAGATPLDRERLDWAALCKNTIERFAPRYASAHLSLTWQESVAEAWVDADGLRLEQVLDNLLVNALRYVPSGGHVMVQLTKPAAAPRYWRLTVQDDGPGLSAEELSHVFERFYRGDQARGVEKSRDLGGSGLGLAIARQIVERHGGAVRARAASPDSRSRSIRLRPHDHRRPPP